MLENYALFLFWDLSPKRICSDIADLEQSSALADRRARQTTDLAQPGAWRENGR